MAIFGPNEAEFQGNQSPFSVQAPVQDKATANLVSDLGSAVRQGLNNFGQVNAQKRQAEQEMAQDSFTGEFQNELLRLTRAHSQGGIGQSEVLTRMNVTLADYTSRNPSAAADMRAVMKDVMSTAGLGKGVAEGTQQEQFIEGLITEAADVGAYDFNATPEVQNQQLNDFMELKRSREQIEIDTQQYNMISARAGSESAEINAQLNSIRQRQRRDTVEYVATRGVTFRNEMINLNSELQSGAIPDQNTAIQMAKDAFAAAEFDIRNTYGSYLEPGHLASLMSTLETSRDDALEVLSGNREATLLETSNRALRAAADAGFLGDPEMAAVISASNLLGNDVFVQQLSQIGSSRKIIEYFSRFNDEDPANAPTVLPRGGMDVEAVRAYNESVLMPGIEMINRGETNPDTIAEVGTQLTGVLNSFVDNVESAKELTQFKPFIDLISSPAVGRYVEAHGLPEGIDEGVAEAFRFNYTDKLEPLIREEWLDAQTRLSNITGNVDEMFARGFTGRTRPATPTRELIDVEFTGSGVRFVPAAGELSAEDARVVRAAAQDLNSKVGNVLNKDIKSMAHLEGHRDYRKIFNQIAERLFPRDFPQGEQTE